MSKEKRKQVRLDAQLFAEIISSETGHVLGRGIVVDASLSGIAIETEANININDRVVCHIEVPIKLDAKVMRSQSNGQLKRYGLKFEFHSIFDKLFFKKALSGSRHTRKIGK